MSSKNKVARLSLVQKDAKSSADLFGLIGKDLHKDILSYVVCVGDPKCHWNDLELLAKSCRDLRRVSKTWRELVGDLMNAQMDDETKKELMSSRDLDELKSRVMQLELKTIGNSFIKDIKETWGSSFFDPDDYDYEYGQYLEGGTNEGPIHLIVQHFGQTYYGFAKIVAIEYLKFLIVKCVETLVAKKSGKDETASELIKTWAEKCMPSKLVDKFWHAHMLSPKKYAADCHFLIGETVDHDAGYVSAASFADSDYESKKKFLFQFEEQLPKWDYFYGRLGNDGEGEASTVLFGSDFNVAKLAAIIWLDMQGFNDCG